MVAAKAGVPANASFMRVAEEASRMADWLLGNDNANDTDKSEIQANDNGNDTDESETQATASQE